MIDLVAWLLLLPPAVMTLVLAVELAASNGAGPRFGGGGDARRTAIIIPAHDEEAEIGGTVAAIRAAAPPGARLIVVADNCTDATATAAAAAGAEVVERHDAERRGKGFALAEARDFLAGDPPEVAVVIDADCRIDRDGLARLAAAARTSGGPVQSAYLMRPRPDLGAIAALSGFALLIRNLVRQRGLARLGAPALLTGSGMAFRWDDLLRAPLATPDLVEDLAIGIAMARHGRAPVFLPTVTTWSDPVRGRAAIIQRTRWEQGFLRTATASAPALLGQARWPLFWLGLHMLVPPLALLALLDGAVLLSLGGLAMAGATPLPFLLLAGSAGGAALLLALSWWRFGRAQISGGRLLLIPLYMLWKLPIYAGALIRPERRWIRTRRD